MVRVIVVVVMLLYSGVAHAGMYFCGDGTKVAWYRHTVDAIHLAPCTAPLAISQVTDSTVAAAQDTLVNTVGLKYLKVSGTAPNGVMVEVTTEERAAIDLPKQQKDAATAVAKDEINNNEVCANHTLPEISSYWKGTGGKSEQLQAKVATMDTAIAAVASGTAKTALLAVRDAMVTHMNMFIDDSERAWRYVCSRTFVKP